jgi:hypothetical protein
VHVPAADVEAVPGNAVMAVVGAGFRVRVGLPGVVEAAEEQGRVGDVLQRLGPVVQVGLEVLQRDPVAGHRREREHVLAHQVEVLARAPQLIAFGNQDGVWGRPFGIFAWCE